MRPILEQALDKTGEEVKTSELLIALEADSVQSTSIIRVAFTIGDFFWRAANR